MENEASPRGSHDEASNELVGAPIVNNFPKRPIHYPLRSDFVADASDDPIWAEIWHESNGLGAVFQSEAAGEYVLQIFPPPEGHDSWVLDLNSFIDRLIRLRDNM